MDVGLTPDRSNENIQMWEGLYGGDLLRLNETIQY